MTDTTETATTETTATGEPGAESTTAVEATEAATEETSILGGEATAEAAAEEKAAVPILPEKYELTPPDGMALDEETLAEADPVFRDIGLSNEAAQKLIPVAAKFGKRIAAQAAEQANQAILTEVTAQRKAWATEAQGDAEIGGTNWAQTQELSAKALDALGYPKGSTFRNFLTESGLGNHPEMIRAFRKVGEMVGEDGDFVRTDAGAQIKLSREAVLYPNDVPAQGAN